MKTGKNVVIVLTVTLVVVCLFAVIRDPRVPDVTFDEVREEFYPEYLTIREEIVNDYENYRELFFEIEKSLRDYGIFDFDMQRTSSEYNERYIQIEREYVGRSVFAEQYKDLDSLVSQLYAVTVIDRIVFNYGKLMFSYPMYSGTGLYSSYMGFAELRNTDTPCNRCLEIDEVSDGWVTAWVIYEGT